MSEVDGMGNIEHWIGVRLTAGYDFQDVIGAANRLAGLPAFERVEVTSAAPDTDRGAVEDRDYFEAALEMIFHGNEDHAWEVARKALDTRPSAVGGQ